MGNRLGPETAATNTKSPTCKPSTHDETKANTSVRQARREASIDKALKSIERGAPGQPPRPTPSVKKGA